MESLIFLVIVLVIVGAFVVWVFRSAWATLSAPGQPAQPQTNAPARPTPRAKASPPPPLDIDPAHVADLRELPSTRYRIKGSAFVVSDANRERFGGTEYQLRREPKNRHDAHAIAVYGKGRKVGYISASKAAAMAPLLDQLPEEAFTVGGTGMVGNSIRLWVDVPSVPALRRYVKERMSRPGQPSALA